MSFQNTFNLSVLLALGLGLLLWSLPVQRGWARKFVVLLLATITLNYAIWRISSLPSFEFNFGSLWPCLFFLLEAPTIVYELWTCTVMTRRSDHSKEADLLERRLRKSDELPTVDVFIATYNESLSVLRGTILAAKGLDYPKDRLRIIVGDDGHRPEVRRFAEEHGVDYLARPAIVNEHGETTKDKIGGSGKGGNDRYSFTQSRGEYIILLDADFCVRPEFVYRTLGFLKYRSDVGLVQTPQLFSNHDIVGHNLLAGDSVPEEQHFFMAVTQASRDAWGNAFCTGTALITSRKLLRLLDPVWGFPNHTICEDLELSYALLGAGYRTLYLNEPLAHGLAPQSIRAFIIQRVRWCEGTVQNLFAPTGPIRGSLRLLDRIFYCEGVVYWLGYIFNALLILAPVVFWFTGVSAVLGTPEAAAAAVFPRLIGRELIMYWLSGGKIPPVIAQVSKVLPAFHVSLAFAKTLIRPRSRVFKVTPKQELLASLPSSEATQCSPVPDVAEQDGPPTQRVIHRPLFCTFLLIALATLYLMVVALLGRSAMTTSSDLIQLNVAWSVWSIFICVLSFLACVERPHVPGDEREVVRSRPLRIVVALVKRCLGINGQPAARPAKRRLTGAKATL